MVAMDPKVKAEAARLLGNGYAASFVASRLRIHPTTVRKWIRVDAAFQALVKQERDGVYAQALVTVGERYAGQTVQLADRVPAGATEEEKREVVRDGIVRLAAKRKGRHG